ncbi:L-ascorbate oxidase isoform X2 [Amborella trichopoda]|uniref:L-ascorbate oxidase isoform X2 n=1 Tax=Amborella trichopoda TaxID=13333 RepID=UPI0009BED340|nr:L-ascorbate oxidase isoform X2 [Amborella trichopoda]|eukprot:XP_020519776.1 L-ascorbate oxidase isoform X2 [Amborella trichopoda]
MKAGTYIYHAHYGLQRSSGLYGSIHVIPSDGVKEPFSYDREHTLLINDWWHKSSAEQTAGLSSIPFRWVNEPQSLLIQGRGAYNCSLVNNQLNSLGTGSICNTTNPECSPHVIPVVFGKTYRLRIASVTSLSAINFMIEGHNMTIVEADGNYVEPVVVQNLNLYSGETYSVIVKADNDPSRNYWAAVNILGRMPKTPTGTAVFNYYPNHPKKPPLTTPPNGPLWNDTNYALAQSQSLKALKGFNPGPPFSSDRAINMFFTQNKIEGFSRWSINNFSFVLPSTPYLIALKQNLPHTFDPTPPPEKYDLQNYDIHLPPKNPNASYSDSIYRLDFNSTIDIILQNTNMLDPNKSETHPWHLHGHHFWVLGHGIGVFDPVNDPKKYNLVNPVVKNTVPAFPYGWTVIRFRADNPGIWAFHCHVEAHYYLGMGVVFEEGIERVARLPKSIMGCGKSKRLARP